MIVLPRALTPGSIGRYVRRAKAKGYSSVNVVVEAYEGGFHLDPTMATYHARVVLPLNRFFGMGLREYAFHKTGHLGDTQVGIAETEKAAVTDALVAARILRNSGLEVTVGGYSIKKTRQDVIRGNKRIRRLKKQWIKHSRK